MMKPQSSDKRTILAVDDKLENLKILIKYLEDSGYELMVAQSGEEALKHVERIVPDIILLDVLMPGIDGFETCRRLKDKVITRDIPIIFMTALTETVDKVRGFEAGAIDYLTKPLQHEEVLARVNAHVNTREFQRLLQQKNVLLQQQITAFGSLMQLEAHAGPIISESPAMRRVKEQINELNRKSGPILITGEQGTGQVYMAKKIHERSASTYAPLIVVNCLQIEGGDAVKILFGSTDLEGYQSEGFGALHLADQGTLVLMHIEALDKTSQGILLQYLADSLNNKALPQIRLIATSSEDIASLAQANRFLPKLARQLTTNEVKMPNMRKRKRDILPLAKLFLAERNQRLRNEAYRLSRSAEHVLLSRQYRHCNADELREAVESAALFADTAEIAAEHIFTGPKSEGTRFDYNLSQIRIIQWFLSGETPAKVLQTIFIVVFLSIISISFTAGNTIPSHIANGLIWGLWWPVLMISFLFFGRVWCTICPLSFAGRIAQRIVSLKLNPPQWLMKHSSWLVVLLLFIIFWSEQVFNMTESPFKTSVLLLTLMAAAMLFAMLFKRETWCRYVCPLGIFGATYAASSMVYVRANPNVCATQCNTHECFKGSATSRECPVFHHPLYARDGHFCKMCFSCLRSCPHGSANLYLRPPFQSIWQLTELNAGTSLMAFTGFFLALVLLCARSTNWLATPLTFTIASLMAVALAVVLQTLLQKVFSRKHNSDPALLSRAALVLVILGWGTFMAFHLQEVPGLAALQIQVVEQSFWASYIPITEFPVLQLFQFMFIFLATVFAMISLYKLWRNFIQKDVKSEQWGLRILLGLCTLYVFTAVGLVMS